ncbi:DNA polymerase IV [uncultured delta proteobacterium]|uniref:DNA polymerase IV n=1 Tax=uncultured delta proteobacterium TaxID=34034 RepID=A0A212JPF6_9DELT|nr:DNA polymerase IV [uncultured delta proteobacterium]
MQRWIMHIDMDAFYASVEQRDNPSLKGLPVIIGGGLRGVVSAASYEARKYGVRSAMPMFRARALCPNGVFLRGRMARYAEVSRTIMAVLQNFSPVVEKASVDEAFLDATGLHRVFGPVENMARELKKAVFEATGLTCSVGLAPVKFLAKIASDMNKPDGLTIVYPEDVPGLLAKLSVGDIPGVGKKTMPSLERLGVRFAADVARYPRDFWVRRFGKMGGVLFDRAGGKDEREVIPFEPPKSESAENTFEEDTKDREFLVTWLLRQADRVGRSLRKQGLAGRTVTLKVKYADFTTLTRAKTLPHRTNVTRVIFDTAVALLEELNPAQKLRLIGVGVSHFDEEEAAAKPKALQLSLLDDAGGPNPAGENRREPTVDIKRESALDAALDAVRDKFGSNMVMRGRLLEREERSSGPAAGAAASGKLPKSPPRREDKENMS